MPSWWGKSSSKEIKKKPGKESFMDTLHRKFKIPSECKSNRCGGSKRHCSDAISELGSHSRAISRSPSPSKQVARCQSFAERPNAQPLPLPSRHHPSSIINRTDSGISISLKPRSEKVSKPSSFLPLPRPACIRGRLNRRDLDGDLVTASVSSESSLDSDDPTTDSRSRSPHATDYENGTRTAASSPPSAKLKEKSSPVAQISLREAQRPVNLFFSNPVSSPTSPKRRPLRNHVLNLQIPYHGSAPDSSISSPSRSPRRAFNSDQAMNSAFWAGKAYPDTTVLGSGHCSSPGSGQNSGHNSMGGDMTGQLFWQHSRGSPEYSPIPSPRMTSPGPGSRMTSPGPGSRMTSPGPSSRIQSGAVTPIHPRCSGPSTETQTEMGKKKSHRLPLPPVTIPSSSPFSYPNSAATSPTMPRSPGRADNPMSPGPRWKKGKLLGRGTFGHVYVGFNIESGEMCAMKEVTLFADDAKSKESAKQLGQEIALLSRLRHPNIVQYYGSETVDDRLYIYLEYVSGGSIHKLLQDYGQFGELAIRSYTQQILSGLAFLHAKSTVHRDIKGANILVDPNGRVKLADFGMAKHISGQSCPLSFKGSPYWMAPEVIKNSSGSNLAVDIWSLGCTVLEMATSKPPWSQYEGIAAMFKIGNSKDLPVIPDHLSDEGKDFVKLCLQRNPKNRPTASQLLEHSFVKNAPSLGFTNGIKTLGSDYTREPSSMDTERLAIHSSRVSRATSPLSSDSFIPRNISCPVSPIGSPILQSRSPQHLSGRLSPSPISSPRTISGSSTPLTGGSGAIPIHHSKHSISLQEGFSGMPKSANNFYVNGNSYYNPNPNIFGGMQPGSHVFPELGAGAGSGSAHGGQSVLADRVSRLLLGDHMKMNPSLDLSPNSPLQSRNNGN